MQAKTNAQGNRTRFRTQRYVHIYVCLHELANDEATCYQQTILAYALVMRLLTTATVRMASLARECASDRRSGKGLASVYAPVGVAFW